MEKDKNAKVTDLNEHRLGKVAVGDFDPEDTGDGLAATNPESPPDDAA